ncbi:DUF551 domain-containing protein [Klebsiella pneumoniae]|nr:DUF551 domain-containing protein [Klebsiella pneumoniae]
MTRSTITRERVQRIIRAIDSESYDEEEIREWLSSDEIMELSRMALAAMDSEPYCKERKLFCSTDTARMRKVISVSAGTGDAPLYRHAQPVPVVPEEKSIPNTLSMYAVDAVAAIAEVKGWNACRAAMLQASPVCTCPSGDGSLRWPCPVHPGNSPAQSDCCPAQNSVNPAQGGNYLVIPDEMTSEQAYEIGYYYGDPVDVFARGANWMRQHIIDSTLAAAPQSPGSEPATVPGKWIPVSERMPERGDYLVTDGCDFDVQLFNGEQFIPGFVWEDKITHWMPLPAAPQEVKGE